ncbi:Hypothetical predicted protein [Octopus vulgaris]|uniref:Uncharacterized protein n=1 Tax=Octopus vulgaris TaxID=6645 RepID=A0AA36BFY6_OCTVU|nr:Hypothetical predicted protein [Octopus vulgaris]
MKLEPLTLTFMADTHIQMRSEPVSLTFVAGPKKCGEITACDVDIHGSPSYTGKELIFSHPPIHPAIGNAVKS